MPEPFENPEVTKLKDKTVSDASAEKRIGWVAERAVQTVHSYPMEYAIFSE